MSSGPLGTELASLHTAAEALGFKAAHGKAKPGVLRSLPLPAIAHLDQPPAGHFIVVYKVKGDSVIVGDPSLGVEFVPIGEFLRRWSGHMLLLAPAADFRPHAKERTHFLWMLRAAKNERRYLASLCICSTVVMLLGLSMAFFVQIIIDRVIPRSDFTLLTLLGISASVLLAARALGVLSRQYLLAGLGCKLEVRLGTDSFRRLSRLSIAFYDKRTPGEVFSYTSDVTQVREAIVDSMASMILNAVFFIICAGAMFAFNSSLGFIALGFLAAFMTLTLMSGRNLTSREWEIRERLTRFAGHYIETLQNMRVVKAYVSEKWAFRRVVNNFVEYQRGILKKNELLGAIAAVSTLLTTMGSVVLLWIGCRFAMAGYLSVGQLMFFYTVLGLCLASIENMTPSLSRLQGALVASERISDIDLAKPERSAGGEVMEKSPTSGDITFENVSFWYLQGYLVLSEVSLTIKHGETVAILGETGCGKTTLAHLLAGLYEPQEGKIFIGGCDTADLDKHLLRSRVAIVFQEPGIICGTVRENIQMGMTNASIDDIQAAAGLARAAAFIRELPKGYDTPVGAGGVGLSSGQKQRIAIARALLRDPLILILDEATSNLDIETEREVLDSLKREGSERTTILITHRVPTALRADRIVIVDHGRIARVGTKEDLSERLGKLNSFSIQTSPSCARGADSAAYP